ncbi:two-component sensor histidine kinase [Nonomuraea sp. MG754425]|nr:two-component sensor histidine kinase [Nonomuraea sp. MG754425]
MALGLAELLFLVVAAPAALIPALRPAAARGRDRLAALEHARLTGLLGHAPARRDGGYAFLAVRAALGVLGGYTCAAALFLTVLLLFGGAWDLLWGESEPVPVELPGVRLVTTGGAVGITAGTALLAVLVLLVAAMATLERRVAARFLGPSGEELMRRRIAELTETRSGVVRAVDDERRRIERDLHDGVQQRGVALAMLLGRARHTLDQDNRARDTGPDSPDGADSPDGRKGPGGQDRADGRDRPDGRDTVAGLVGQAYAESRRLLDELRSVAWRIYPTALDELGLRAALAGVAERAGAPVTVHYGLAARPASEIETALYFVAREAITNAVKHAGAHDILVVLTEDDSRVSVEISDDGEGGADPSGGGLSGLARRVLALDGTFTVDSAPGGPTRIAATLPKAPPCG